jgi:hypothetical protein
VGRLVDENSAEDTSQLSVEIVLHADIDARV